MTIIVSCKVGASLDDIIHHMDKAGCRDLKHTDVSVTGRTMDKRHAEQVYNKLKNTFVDGVIIDWKYID